MTPLFQHIQWMLGKWHTNGIHRVSREDYATLEALFLQARKHRDELEEAAIEFVDAMNSPRGDAPDRRRKAALTRMRKARSNLDR